MPMHVKKGTVSFTGPQLPRLVKPASTTPLCTAGRKSPQLMTFGEPPASFTSSTWVVLS